MAYYRVTVEHFKCALFLYEKKISYAYILTLTTRHTVVTYIMITVIINGRIDLSIDLGKYPEYWK